MSEFIPPPPYELRHKLGSGGFSVVHSAWDRYRQMDVAIKVFFKSDAEGISLCRKEFERTESLSHPNIVEFYDFGEIDGSPYIVMPYYGGGTVQEKLGSLSEMKIWELVNQIASALSYIHSLSPPVLHNDLKPDNILIADDGRYVLVDFGISTRLTDKLLRSRDLSSLGRETGGRGPMAYRAPELFQFQDRQKLLPVKASDIWSFGASLYEIATGHLPFGDEGGLRLQADMRESGKTIEDCLVLDDFRYSDQLLRLIVRCLALDTWHRPSAASIFEESAGVLHALQGGSSAAYEPFYSAHVETHPETDRYSEKPRATKQGQDKPRKEWNYYLLGTAVLLACFLLVIGILNPFSGSNSNGLIAKPTEPPVKYAVPYKKNNEYVNKDPEPEERGEAKPNMHGNDNPVESSAPPIQSGRFPKYRAEHDRFHYVFCGYSSQDKAEADASKWRASFTSEPVTVVQVSTFGWEIYFGNFPDSRSINQFQKKNFVGVVGVKVRHGDGEKR
jgi:serine/threonine protein kinase